MADEKFISVKLTETELGLIRDALEFTSNSLAENHKNTVRFMKADVAKALWDNAMDYINVKERLHSPDDVGADLADALFALMAAEGGEPGGTDEQKYAWEQAETVLKFHGYD